MGTQIQHTRIQLFPQLPPVFIVHCSPNTDITYPTRFSPTKSRILQPDWSRQHGGLGDLPPACSTRGRATRRNPPKRLSPNQLGQNCVMSFAPRAILARSNSPIPPAFLHPLIECQLPGTPNPGSLKYPLKKPPLQQSVPRSIAIDVSLIAKWTPSRLSLWPPHSRT